jgi:hypothetical protein
MKASEVYAILIHQVLNLAEWDFKAAALRKLIDRIAKEGVQEDEE